MAHLSLHLFDSHLLRQYLYELIDDKSSNELIFLNIFAEATNE
jgi:hypothetical protein